MLFAKDGGMTKLHIDVQCAASAVRSRVHHPWVGRELGMAPRVQGGHEVHRKAVYIVFLTHIDTLRCVITFYPQLCSYSHQRLAKPVVSPLKNISRSFIMIETNAPNPITRRGFHQCLVSGGEN